VLRYMFGGIIIGFIAISGSSSEVFSQDMTVAGERDYLAATAAAGRDLVVDDSGNVYVTGAGAGDFLTLKYSPDGSLLAVMKYDGFANHNDGACCIELSPDGNLVVAGQSVGSDLTYDYAAIKYSPNGDRIWVRRFVSTGTISDYTSTLAIDKLGYVYVAGNRSGYFCTISRCYGWAEGNAIKYAPDGESLWTGYIGNMVPQTIKTDEGGNLYLTGFSYSYSSLFGIWYEYVTQKRNAQGQLLWNNNYNYWGFSLAYDLQLDDSLNIYITGNSGTFKYSAGGDSVWFDTAINGQAIGSDASGNLYITGGDGTFKLSPAGDVLWTRAFKGKKLALDSYDNVYLIGGTTDYQIVKYSNTGDSLWEAVYDGPSNDTDQVAAIFIDKNNYIYVTGRSSNNAIYGIATIKYSASGDSIWVRRFDYDYIPGLCLAIPGDVDSSGSINVSDIIQLVNYIFDKDKSPCLGCDPGNCWTPVPFCRGDVNASSTITLGDIILLINFLLDKDRPPCLRIDPGKCWTLESNGPCCLPVP